VGLYRTWHDAWRSGRIALPTAIDAPLGKHAIVAVGYQASPRRIDFVIRNSWGADWGDDGYGYLPAAYVDRYAVAAWALS
jgi:C1A family cysteine protease